MCSTRAALRRASYRNMYATTSSIYQYIGMALLIFTKADAFQPAAAHAVASASGDRRSQSSTAKTSHITLQLEPGLAVAGTVAIGAAVVWLSGSEDRQRQTQYLEYEEKEKQIREKRAKLAYIEPKDYWTVEEIAQYDGSDPDGPILLGVDGTVFNVWKGRNFYGEGGEYHVMAGRDATRLLAKTSLEEAEYDTTEPLSIAEKATLEAWFWTFKAKYEVVGKLSNDGSSRARR